MFFLAWSLTYFSLIIWPLPSSRYTPLGFQHTQSWCSQQGCDSVSLFQAFTHTLSSSILFSMEYLNTHAQNKCLLSINFRDRVRLLAYSTVTPLYMSLLMSHSPIHNACAFLINKHVPMWSTWIMRSRTAFYSYTSPSEHQAWNIIGMGAICLLSKN